MKRFKSTALPGSLAGMIPVLALVAMLVAGCSGGEEKTPSPAGKTAAPASAGTSEVNRDGDLAAGKKIYEEYCHFCHGMKGYGDGPVGIAISPHPADFIHDDKRMSQSDEKLFESITYGIQKEMGGEEMAMPRWKEILSAQERWDVLAYVRELERKGREAEGLPPLEHEDEPETDEKDSRK